MGRIRIRPPATPDPTVIGFKVDDETTINGRHVERGMELTIKGNGRVKFHSLTTNPRNGVQWINAFDKYGKWRSFDPSAVTTVHRLHRGRP